MKKDVVGMKNYFAGYFRNKERRFSGQDGKRIAAWRQEERTG